MRRFLLLLVGLLFLSACGATDTAAIRLGDESITEQELVQLVASIGTLPTDAATPGLSLEQAAAAMAIDTEIGSSVVDAQALRSIGVTWLQNVAEQRVLADRDIVLTDQARLETEAALLGFFRPDVLAEINGTEAHEALIRNFWLQGVIANIADPQPILDLMSSPTIKSNLGEFDPELFAIVEVS